ncbi:MAG: neutral zinc metallopeptidase, partial [Muribaculaceae bacterium]|nr:neutral zinc metallopeptidase [Muribaculaceae bacterium]
MRLDGRRESSNVEDRRGMSTGKKVGIGGIGGLIIAGILTLLMGGNIGDVLQQAGNMGAITGTEQEEGQREFTQEEQELAEFSKKILAGTEDVWSQVFRENGLGEYQAPTMVLYTGSTSTACGQGSAQMGPFYCSGDQCLYIDLSFFSSMKRQLGADGDFAYAYVIAHEVGHHVEYLLGTLNKAHQQMSRMSEADANKISVR